MINGYVRKPVTQAQVTVTQFFDRVLAADRLTVVGEVGYNHLSGVDGDDLRYGRDAIYGIGELPNNALCTGALNVANPQECTATASTPATRGAIACAGSSNIPTCSPGST